MTDYDRIVYLDSDMLVVSNIDHLFNCGTFCAAYRRMDLFNAGVMMLIPSTEIFQEMLSMLPYTHSYDNGDQGFLNVYFKDLLYASMFNWSDNKQRKEKGHLRLPAGLNADISRYYLDGKWKIPEEQLRVIHFTFLSVKPWMWWSNSLLDLNGQWNDVRSRLPQYEEAVSCSALCSSMYWLPYPFLALFFVALYLSECCSCAKFLVSEFEMFGSLNSRVYHFFPLSFLFVSYSLAFKIVPTTMMPSQAEYVFWLWSNFFLLTFISLYCYLCHIAAGLRANQQLVSSSSRKKLRTLTLYLVFTVSYVLVKAVPALVEPFWWRVKVFCVLVVVHVLVSQVTGQWVIGMWTGSPKTRSVSCRLSPVSPAPQQKETKTKGLLDRGAFFPPPSLSLPFQTFIDMTDFFFTTFFCIYIQDTLL